jgi:integrase/recombinase XerD
MQQIADWLEKLGMSEYTERFADNDIDASVLRDLTDQDLKDIGVSLGHRRKLLLALRLFVEFAAERLKVRPSVLQLEQLDAPLVLEFLTHLETQRHNSPPTRNVRLAAIRTFMRFVEYREPSALAQIKRVLAIPMKRANTRLIDCLTRDEMQALLDAPAPNTRDGIRDRAMLYVGYSAGLRVSELVGLRLEDMVFNPRLSIRVLGKGRRERALPLWRESATALRAWLSVRPNGRAPEVFLNTRGEAMTRSGFEYVLDKHVQIAARHCPSLAASGSFRTYFVIRAR